MSDAAGRTMENTVNYLLSECTWGYVNPLPPFEWVCVSNTSSIEPPVTNNINGRSLISYKKSVDNAHSYQDLAIAKDSDIDQIKTVKKVAKQKRTALQSAFTDGDNAPGFRVQQSFEDVMQKLHFPHGKHREAAKQLATTMSKSRLQEAWNVARELDLFVDDHHPIGLPALPDRFRLKLKPNAHCIVTFYCDGFEADGTALGLGTLTKNVKVIRGFQSIQKALEGASVDFEKSCGKYLQRVEPLAAVTDPNYFISLFESVV
ncbi:unnamed protein product [Peronospora destructor]|uniref:Uncharacterized protein n=1 Tax=Peronospora destructor TaxID=86335 RepID=A0AAV0UJY1_9STRA|nr:unnamed protein product [Peronospora destructor]